MSCLSLLRSLIPPQTEPGLSFLFGLANKVLSYTARHVVIDDQRVSERPHMPLTFEHVMEWAQIDRQAGMTHCVVVSFAVLCQVDNKPVATPTLDHDVLWKAPGCIACNTPHRALQA